MGAPEKQKMTSQNLRNQMTETRLKRFTKDTASKTGM